MDPVKLQTEVDVDLFGNPVVALRDRRGRPSFAKTKENQEFVALRAADGWSHLRIAEALGCDDDTLRKHFSGELENGQLIIEGVMLDVLMLNVRRGHVPSIRLLQERIKATAPIAPKQARAAETSPELNSSVGKKQARLDEAQDVPEDYGDIYNRRRAN